MELLHGFMLTTGVVDMHTHTQEKAGDFIGLPQDLGLCLLKRRIVASADYLQ